MDAPAPSTEQLRRLHTAAAAAGHRVPASAASVGVGAAAGANSCGAGAARCAHSANLLLGLVMGAAALVTFIFACCALVLVMMILMRNESGNGGPAGSGQVSSRGASGGVGRGGPAGSCKEEYVSSDVLDDARLVLLPGEERPRVVAVPSELPIIVLVHPHPSSSSTAAAEEEEDDIPSAR